MTLPIGTTRAILYFLKLGGVWSRRPILNPEENPLVVDPFAGGGSIPLEAMRLGCETFASDLNPVACLILKVMLEDIPGMDRSWLRSLDGDSTFLFLQGIYFKIFDSHGENPVCQCKLTNPEKHLTL